MSDYIERDKALDKFIEGDGDDEFTEGYNFAINEYREKIKAMPSADVQEKRYCRMIPLEPDCRGYTDVFICTNCHQHIHLGLIQKEYSGSFCLECGAEVKDGDTNG